MFQEHARERKLTTEGQMNLKTAFNSSCYSYVSWDTLYNKEWTEDYSWICDKEFKKCLIKDKSLIKDESVICVIEDEYVFKDDSVIINEYVIKNDSVI